MYRLDNKDYHDVLNLINCCISCLTSGGKTKDILIEMLKSFEADEAVFLSANNDYDGVDLGNSYTLCRDRAYLIQYADYFWRYDPLYNMQFCPTFNNTVFKTDDVISYSQMVKLEYYNSFLRPQNLLRELIIRLYSEGNLLGAISLHRCKERPNFDKRDIQKASILVPYLIKTFDIVNRFSLIDEERVLFEEWMESCSEGIILLDSGFRSLYCNSKAKLFCLLACGMDKRVLDNAISEEILIPTVMIQDCKNLTRPGEGNSLLNSNRIVNISHNKRYYIQYFPILSPSLGLTKPRFIIFLKELTGYSEDTEEILPKEHKLSRREESIAQYAAIGLTNKQIAEKLCISPFTVQNHLKSVFQKTGLDNRTQLANFVKYTDSPSS